MDDPADLAPDTALAAPAFAMVDFGASRGLDRTALLAAAGLDESLRADPDSRVSTFAFVVLWRELLVGLPGVVVPVELARAVQARDLGVVGEVVLRADHIAHAFDLHTRFLRLIDTAVAMTRIDRDGLVGLAVSHRPEVEAMRFPIELMLGLGYRLLQHGAGSALPLREVTFAHAAGFPVEPYVELFGAPVRFGEAPSALWLAPETFVQPFASRDPIVRRYLETHAQTQLASVTAPAPAPLVQIRDAILVELATSGAELSRVAKRVAMSARTVQRRLEEAGTSYQQLVDDVRAQLARSLLRDRSRSIIDIAFELGYADLKGFYRAFRRWTDATPAEWREQALGA